MSGRQARKARYYNAVLWPALRFFVKRREIMGLVRKHNANGIAWRREMFREPSHVGFALGRSFLAITRDGITQQEIVL